MPEHIGRYVRHREIGHWHVPCNQSLSTLDDENREPLVREDLLKFEIYTDEGGIYRWRLLASDGQVMATSKESYRRSEDVRRAIVALQASIPVARIVDGSITPRSTP